MGTGVAPGVRHNPVFGSPGEEFPPLNPSPGQHIQSLEPGAPPEVPETRGLCHLTQCCRSVEEGQGQALPEEKSREGLGRGLPRTKGGEGEDPSPRSWPLLRPRRGERLGTPASFWGLAGAPTYPSVAQGPTK